MSINPDLRPTLLKEYGTTGVDTIEKMNEALKEHSLSFSYNVDSKWCTIHGSSHLSQEVIQDALNQQIYEGWRPELLNEKNDQGNFRIRLVPIDNARDRAIINEQFLEQYFNACKKLNESNVH